MLPRNPAPVSAVFNSLGNTLAVTFDQELAGGSTSANQIYLNPPAGNRRRVQAQAFAGGTVVTFNTATDVSPSDGSQTCDYDGSPASLVGVNGAPVLAWTDLPYTIV